MDILIPDSWLREYLDTSANPKQIQEAMSLSGPSIERLTKVKDDWVYNVEVTTNRIDTFSIIGFAFEAVAILGRFGYKAKLKKDPYLKRLNLSTKAKVKYLDVKVDKNLCKRFSAVLIKDIKVGKSPEFVTKRLEMIGMRPINNIVDISNYLMHEMGQPVHIFDYDKIAKNKMILRESKKGEKITTLDGKSHLLPGGDIVIEDGEAKLIDLCGIMGGQNSAVTENTKNILLFVQVYNGDKIRKTSMSLAHRTDAANIFEKNLPVENVLPTLNLGIKLLKKLAGGEAEKNVLDILNTSEKLTTVKFPEPINKFVSRILGVNVSINEIKKILASLEFKIKSSTLVEVPWVRKLDVVIPEDVAEEVARLYGYHNLPSNLMSGSLPKNLPLTTFGLENKVKQILKGYGGTEVYTLSLVSGEEAGSNALRLKNSLGSEGEYLRTSLRPSLINAAKSNSFEKESFHLFEIANIYIPKSKDLPEEKFTLAGVFSETDFRKAKGIVKSLLYELNIYYLSTPEDSNYFKAAQRLVYKSKSGEFLGELGTLDNGLIFYQFSIEKLQKHYSSISNFKPIPKFPPQIEDLTFTFPDKTKIGEVLSLIKKSDKQVSFVKLLTIYKSTFTIRVYYQHPNKTLTNEEVEKLRVKAVESVKRKFGGSLKN